MIDGSCKTTKNGSLRLSQIRTIQLESGNDRGLLPLKMGSHLECVATVKLRWLRNHNATANDDYDDGDSGLMFRLLNVGL